MLHKKNNWDIALDEAARNAINKTKPGSITPPPYPRHPWYMQPMSYQTRVAELLRSFALEVEQGRHHPVNVQADYANDGKLKKLVVTFSE